MSCAAYECQNQDALIKRMRLDHALEVVELYQSRNREIAELKATIAQQARQIAALRAIIEREATLHTQSEVNTYG